MITIWIPMGFGRHVVFGCAVLATDASLRSEPQTADVAPVQPTQESGLAAKVSGS